MDEENLQLAPEPTTPTETPISEPNPIPANPDEPTAEASVPPIESVPALEPHGPTEATPSPESAVPVKDDIPANEPLEPAPIPENTSVPENPNITVEKRGNDVTITEVMEPTAHSEPATAQMAGNEPLTQKRKENLKLANEKRQSKKREKVNDILNLFTQNSKITNDEVEKLLHVSDATATRYLETLEKEGKIKQVGKSGKYTHYEKIQ